MVDVMSRIENLIVLMLENRSFDNLLGWLYEAENPPRRVIGGNNPYDPPFFGLTPRSYWNPSNASFFRGAPPVKVFAMEGTGGASPFTVPDPTPNELFDNVTFQLFGTTTPAEGQLATMLGFLADYETLNPADPSAIMGTYGTGQLAFFSDLAASYAVSDAWFAPAPCQTWPNRAFAQTGTSGGRVNNAPYNPFDYDVPTIFNVLEESDRAWAVYSPGLLPSLTHLQFPRLWDLRLGGHFRGLDDFHEQAAAGTLPTYSFLEPDFLMDPDDWHPPHNVCRGEQLVRSVYEAVAGGKNWEKTLLVITFDESGGCPDHVPPPWGAVPPDSQSVPGEDGFSFDRFGARVPTILVSPWISPGTVFRSSTKVPFDHTSILATLRDWLKITPDRMLTSRRVAAAPTFGDVLDAAKARTDLPSLATACDPAATSKAAVATTPLTDVQRSMLAATVHKGAGGRVGADIVSKVLATIQTREHAATFLAT